MPEPPQATGLIEAFNPDALPYALAWVLGSVILMRILRRVLATMSERISKYRLAIKQTNTLLSFVVYLAAFVLAFNSLFNLSSELIFALSGTLGGPDPVPVYMQAVTVGMPSAVATLSNSSFFTVD